MRKAIFMLFICTSFVVNATTYYVSTSGSNSNNGTSLTTPWLTWQYGFDRLKAGDILYIRGGTYRTTGNASTSTHIYMSNLAGTSSSHITISAYNGEVPVFNLDNITTNQGSCFALLMTGCTYVDVKGLTITGLAQPSSASNVAGFFISGGSSHVTIENCVVHHIGGYGFTCNNSNYITYKNCDAHHCADPYSSSGAWENANGFGVTGGVALNTSDNITYDGCRSWNNADDGFDFYGVDAFITVNNCWSFWNGYDDSFNALGNGQGFKLGPNYSSTYNNTVRRVITNTISAGNKYHGFDKNYGEMGGGCVMKFYNNVAYGNAKYGWEFTYGSNVADVFKNNIAAANGSGPANLESNAISDHNSWNGSTTVSNSDFQNYTISALTAPRQSDGSLPQITAFHLAVGSKLIDAGVDVGLPFTGNAPDLGAFEVQSGTTVQVPLLSSASVESLTPSILELTYDLTLANVVPVASSFSVLINSSPRSVSAIAVSGVKVRLTLSSRVVSGDKVTVSYTKPSSNYLQTNSSGVAASISNIPVLNNCQNAAPVAVLTSPVTNSSFISPAIISMTASATDPDGSVSLVEFYSGNTRLGSVSVAPYSFTWNNVVAGSYSLTAVVTDNQNSKSFSPAVSVSVADKKIYTNKHPVIRISNPLKGNSYANISTITIDAVASDPDGTISKVEFFNGSDRLAETTTAPYTYIWKDVAPGSYAITAVATDNLNDTTMSAPVEFVIAAKIKYDANSEIVKLYPNPNNGRFTIEFLNPIKSDNSLIVITDIAGKQVYNGPVLKEEIMKRFDLSGSRSGVYVMLIKDKDIYVTKKFIKN
jgi:uncharacterized repeat protein (TIGR02059 family)